MMNTKELQIKQLQEENYLLQEQIFDVEHSNSQLRSELEENSLLRSKINKMELMVSEISQQTKILQEDNGQLLSHITQMKDEMTIHYDECQKKLESLHVSCTKWEEYCKHLIKTNRHLEKILLVKEEESIVKDKEVQKIDQDLMEHQLLSDCLVTNKFGNCILHQNSQRSEVVENLAAELQSSLGDTPFKKQMAGSVSKPDFTHPAAACSILLEPEPEYEDDEPISITTSISNAGSTSSGQEHKAIQKATVELHSSLLELRNEFYEKIMVVAREKEAATPPRSGFVSPVTLKSLERRRKRQDGNNTSSPASIAQPLTSPSSLASSVDRNKGSFHGKNKPAAKLGNPSWRI